MFAVLRRHPSPKEEALTQMQRLLAARGYAGFTFGSNKELGASLDKCVSKNDPFFNTSPRLRFQSGDVVDRCGGSGGSKAEGRARGSSAKTRRLISAWKSKFAGPISADISVVSTQNEQLVLRLFGCTVRIAKDSQKRIAVFGHE